MDAKDITRIKNGLENLIEDRKSFITGDNNHDGTYEYDIGILYGALIVIENHETLIKLLEFQSR